MKYLIVFLCFAFAKALTAQEQPVDSLIRVTAGYQTIDEAVLPDAVIYSKDNARRVVVNHRGIEMTCDRAVLYQKDNFLRAVGNVIMKQGDSITMTCNYAEYNGNTQLAFASEKVNMITPDTRLTTDTLFFNRIKQQAYYRSGGTVRDSASTLTSRVGRFYVQEQKYRFIDDVVVTNPEYTINSNHLDFYEENGHAFMYGPSTITGKTSKVYCERGFYDTRGDTGYFVKNSRIDYNTRTITGDSLYFSRPRNFASATNNIVVTDTINNSIIKGHYAEVYRDKDSVMITKRPLAITIEQQDSVYMTANKLIVTGPKDNRFVRGYNDVRLFKTDLSGKCDSITTRQSTGLTKMIRKPILWSGKSQMTGDSIFLQSNVKTEKLDSLRVFYNAFIIDQDSSGGFNQIKGKELTGFFKNNELDKVFLNKNVENLIYSRNDKQELIGINKGTSGTMEIEFEDKAISIIAPADNSEDILYPPKELPENARTLRGFNWRGDERLITKADLFKGKKPPVLTKIKGIPLPELDEGFFDEEDGKLNENSVLQNGELENRIENQSKELQQPSGEENNGN
ncbi:hypothetical protein JCM19294_544 [Nonlabens tegetincola]|uniref:Organic solvent tolerance-like N-terminal domain-containing protein n=1 Tax=Nonlabens tegetincola TaxID=323273 RepID=A0A090Q5M7_9FLAO|nr:OstA-like protein [Nonlabens tegetincola]GAK97038.1 hypothetical protein JCM19294_544 [Nonlabens tegetincola]